MDEQSAKVPGSKRRSHLPRWGKILILLVALAVTPLIALFVAAGLPLRLAALQGQYTPFVQREGRRAASSGCGLNQVAVAGGCGPAKPSSVDEIEVTFPSRLTNKYLPTLKGTLSVPRGLPGKRPAVVLIHGSGPQNRDCLLPGDVVRPSRPAVFPMFRVLAKLLAEQGLVVLRYDKRTCGGCYPDMKVVPSQFRISDLADDARDGLAFVQTRPEVDPHALVVIGHSQGGKLAPAVAHGNDDVAAVIMLAGTTQSFRDGLCEQYERVAQLRENQWDYFQAMAMRDACKKWRQCVEQLAGDYDPNDPCPGGGTVLQMVKDEADEAAKTLDRIKTLHCPLLVLHGALDRNVPPSIAIKIAKAVKGRDAEVHLLANLGHLLNDLTDLRDPAQFAPSVPATIGDFLKSVKRPRVP